MRKVVFSTALCALLNAPALAAADSWTIDPAHSSANFTIRHMMISNVKGSFGSVKGTVHYDGNNLKNASVDAEIAVDSVDTHNEKRDGHLKSPDFFDMAKFPAISFKSNKSTPTASGFDLGGDLTIHGVTKAVTLHVDKLSSPIKDPYGNERIGTSAQTKINRKDFGMKFNQQLDNGGVMVGDDVTVELDIEMTKNKE